MKSVDKLYQTLKRQYAGVTLTTEDIANIMNLSRGVVSGYLSELYHKGQVNKLGTRPIYWQVNSDQSEFSKVIGSTGSLKNIIEACKESIVYPNNGFPMIITGPSGVGKSFLAKTIYEEAKKLKVIKNESEFVVLNAADYANNPELLSSVLFGYKHGAFTGAEKDTLGLLDKANNGYLFIDEVHRLPHASQEKLFSLLDSGSFYPLGENETPHDVNVRFLFATTENLDNYMLKTFMRRITMHVELMSFIERPVVERLMQIFKAFQLEAYQTHKIFKISSKLIIDLANRDWKANIGEMKNYVKLLCAKGYNLFQEEDVVPIGKQEGSIIEISETTLFSNIMNPAEKIKNEFNELQDEIIDSINNGRDFSDQVLIIQQRMRTLSEFKEPALIKMMQEKLFKILQLMKKNYGISPNLSQNEVEQIAFAMSLSLYRNNNTNWENTLEEKLQKKYPRSFYVYKQVLSKDDFFKDKDNMLIVFFLIIGESIKNIEDIKYTGIVLSHGESTASSIRNVVNNLCRNYIFEAFDMPIDVSVNEIIDQVKMYLHNQRLAPKGIVVMFDMGSLNQMFSEIKRISNSELLVVNNVTTTTALDIAIRIQRNDEFQYITKAAENFGDSMGIQYYEGLSNQANIVVSCMSGVGLSEAIKKMMIKNLSGNAEVITMDYKDLKNTLDTHDQSFFKTTNFVITTTDISTPLDIPVINIYDIMTKPGYNKLKALLANFGEKVTDIEKLMDSFLKFLTLEGIRDRLQFLNSDVVINEVQLITSKYQEYYGIELEGKIKLNLYMHLSLMIERMLLSSQKKEHFIELKAKNPQEEEFFSISKTIFHPIEIKYNFIIEDYEISLMYQLLGSYIK